MQLVTTVGLTKSSVLLDVLLDVEVNTRAEPLIEFKQNCDVIERNMQIVKTVIKKKLKKNKTFLGDFLPLLTEG